MRVRHLVAQHKVLSGDTGWKDEDIPPRYTGVYSKTRPNRAGWRWRSAVAATEHNEYIFFTHIHVEKDKWNSWLVSKLDDGCSIVARFEYHGSHPGVHLHAHCDRGGIEVGPGSIDGLARIPKSSVGPEIELTPDRFWNLARERFRIEFPKGTLL